MDIKDIQDKSKRYRSNKESHSLHKLSKLKEPHRLLQYLCENMFNTRRAILFANKQTFLIHDAEKDCSQSLSQLKKS